MNIADLNKSISDLAAKHYALERETYKVANEFKNALKNKEFPLKERLKLYFKSPEYLKDVKSYCYSPESQTLKYLVEEEINECNGRNSLIRIDDLDRYESVLDKNFDFVLDEYDEDEIIKAFEELLASGYGAYHLDW